MLGSIGFGLGFFALVEAPGEIAVEAEAEADEWRAGEDEFVELL